uniref:Uncharacterized protein n=1 Tax=Nelumbo nucifera TaxID=4432 RepID=A0A822YD96_NELNU|nr:TPA_asm: hypothetical protein HUJ06_030969 [Nelumbo nucifera]
MSTLLYSFFPTDLLPSVETQQQVLPHQARTREGNIKVEQLRAQAPDNLDRYNFFPTDLLPSFHFSSDGDRTRALVRDNVGSEDQKNLQRQEGPGHQGESELSLFHLSCSLPIS